MNNAVIKTIIDIYFPLLKMHFQYDPGGYMLTPIADTNKYYVCFERPYNYNFRASHTFIPHGT